MSRALDRERLRLEVRRAFRPFLVLVAFLAVVVVCASVILGNIGVAMPWTDTYERSVALDDASGVVPGKQAVRLSGIEVGLIEEVDVRGGQAVARIRIDPENAPLYKDARLRVRPETPLDDIYLDIVDRGTPGAGELGEDEVLRAERTRVAVDVGRVINVFDADTRSRVEAAIDGYGRGLGENGDDFRRALVELAPFLDAAKKLTGQTARRQAQTRRLVHDFRLLAEELARRDADLRRLVRGGAGSLTELGVSEAAVRSTLTELGPTLSQLQQSFRTLRAAADAVDPALTALRPVAAALPAGLEGLGDFGTAALPSFRALRKPLPRLEPLVRSLRPTARSLRAAVTDLRPVPERIAKVLGFIIPCELALQNFFHHTNSVGKFEDDDSVVLRGQAVVGLSTVGGAVNDPNQTAAKSCAPGGPSQ